MRHVPLAAWGGSINRRSAEGSERVSGMEDLDLVRGPQAFWGLSHLTLDVGFWDIFWPQLWQGVGFALIFVALTTAALATIPREEMTQAVGLYNVVRQVFGSIGSGGEAVSEVVNPSAIALDNLFPCRTIARAAPSDQFGPFVGCQAFRGSHLWHLRFRSCCCCKGLR